MGEINALYMFGGDKGREQKDGDVEITMEGWDGTS